MVAGSFSEKVWFEDRISRRASRTCFPRLMRLDLSGRLVLQALRGVAGLFLLRRFFAPDTRAQAA